MFTLCFYLVQWLVSDNWQNSHRHVAAFCLSNHRYVKDDNDYSIDCQRWSQLSINRIQVFRFWSYQRYILMTLMCRPNEEDTDNHSDEESFVSLHASDIGSPVPSLAPSTPSAGQLLGEGELFKKPLPIEKPNPDLIVNRTRYKLPLTDTPLEQLEMALVAPDITTDMYYSDCDNEEWRQFLKVL